MIDLAPLSRGSLCAMAFIALAANTAIAPVSAQEEAAPTSQADAQEVAQAVSKEVADAVTAVPGNSAVEEAIAFTRDLTDRANAAFMNEDDESQQLLNFQTVLTDGLALDLLGRFMLGQYRNDLTEIQQQRYDDIFPAYITRLYADQFKDIAGKNLTINEATPFGRRDVIVRTQFFRDNGTPVNVDWRARKFRSGEHKMIDIIVSGVSIMTVKREEFTSFIAANGIDALIDELERDASS